ncbi:MAG TPA: PIG-L family deacetylase [Vicinamibacteria bacterium]|nr:PIG-L family deacetylase [Vicinamibacteria bacterium]
MNGSRIALGLVFLALALPAAAEDDRYRFAPGYGAELSVNLAADGGGARFDWPRPVALDWDTALVGVRVEAGTEPDPWVEIGAGSASVRQHFEAGARGLRWLNLTGLRAQLADGTPVTLAGHGLKLEGGPSALRVFANRLDWRKKILVLAPHPDDAEIAAFGLYAGSNATIVTVTSGNAGDANYRDNFHDPAEQYLFKGYIRAVDSVTVPWQGGIPPERCYNLGYFDARLATMHAKPSEVVPEMYGPNDDVAPYRRANVGRLLANTSGKNRWSNLVDDLVAVLKKVKPGVVVMPYPQLDTHLDHEFVSVAAVEALERWNGDARFLLYTNHAFDNLYPFGPAGSTMSLPPWSGAELPVEAVFAKTVSPDLQRRKLFALESMHDLRLSPAEQHSCLPPGLQSKRDDYPRVPEKDYLRRGPRSEELFFVYGRRGVQDLIRSFLSARRESTN